MHYLCPHHHKVKEYVLENSKLRHNIEFSMYTVPLKQLSTHTHQSYKSGSRYRSHQVLQGLAVCVLQHVYRGVQNLPVDLDSNGAL